MLQLEDATIKHLRSGYKFCNLFSNLFSVFLMIKFFLLSSTLFFFILHMWTMSEGKLSEAWQRAINLTVHSWWLNCSVLFFVLYCWSNKLKTKESKMKRKVLLHDLKAFSLSKTKKVKKIKWKWISWKSLSKA